MVAIDVQYLGELRCEATHVPSGARLTTDAPRDNHGKGESFSPTDLVATALGTCMATIMGLVAARHDVDLRGMRVTVEKHMVSEPLRRIGRLQTEIHVPLDPGPRLRETLERAALTCPVHQSLGGTLELPVRFHWGGA